MVRRTLALCNIAFLLCVLFASGGTDASYIDRALVSVDSEAPAIVYSLHFNTNDPVEIIIGRSVYTIPFKDIKELEIYKDANIVKAQLKNVSGKEIDGELKYSWVIAGTTEENGFKGEFRINPDSVNTIRITRLDADDDESSQMVSSKQSDNTVKIENYGDTNQIHGSNVTINEGDTNINSSTIYDNKIIKTINNNFNLVVELILFSLLSFGAIKIILERRKKQIK